MKWVRDLTGRFLLRPYYLERELDERCEAIVTDLLIGRYGRVTYPLSTDDVVRLVERAADDLDLYADLSAEGEGLHGVTDFFPTTKPRVRIARELSEDPRRVNRLRTTLTHEFGHVTFHAVLCRSNGSAPLPLFETMVPTFSPRCHRDTILTARSSDWMEWQAGYACGAFLMPLTAITGTVGEMLAAKGLYAPLGVNTPEGDALISTVQTRFLVSADAARVRLLKLGYLAQGAVGTPLFLPSSAPSRRG